MTSSPSEACAELEGLRAAGTLAGRSDVTRFVVGKLGNAPWQGTRQADGAVFDVEARPLDLTNPLTAVFVLRPRWATDQRPYVVGCSRQGRALALSGFARPDGAELLLATEAFPGAADTALLGMTVELAKLLDTNLGDQLVLGLDDPISRAAGNDATARLFGYRVAGDLTPVVQRDPAGAIVVVNASSANSWDAMGLPDFVRYRARFDRSGRVIWLDRVILAGRWKIELSKPDSVRFQRDTL
ncbi:MAG: hypothetical protein ACRDHF_01375 [Tepidiformaceae bacterium]